MVAGCAHAALVAVRRRLDVALGRVAGGDGGRRPRWRGSDTHPRLAAPPRPHLRSGDDRADSSWASSSAARPSESADNDALMARGACGDGRGPRRATTAPTSGGTGGGAGAARGCRAVCVRRAVAGALFAAVLGHARLDRSLPAGSWRPRPRHAEPAPARQPAFTFCPRLVGRGAPWHNRTPRRPPATLPALPPPPWARLAPPMTSTAARRARWAEGAARRAARRCAHNWGRRRRGGPGACSLSPWILDPFGCWDRGRQAAPNRPARVHTPRAVRRPKLTCGFRPRPLFSSRCPRSRLRPWAPLLNHQPPAWPPPPPPPCPKTRRRPTRGSPATRPSCASPAATRSTARRACKICWRAAPSPRPRSTLCATTAPCRGGRGASTR